MKKYVRSIKSSLSSSIHNVEMEATQHLKKEFSDDVIRVLFRYCFLVTGSVDNVCENVFQSHIDDLLINKNYEKAP